MPFLTPDLWRILWRSQFTPASANYHFTESGNRPARQKAEATYFGINNLQQYSAVQKWDSRNRTEDSQSSNPGSIPGSATITAAITYAISRLLLKSALWLCLWLFCGYGVNTCRSAIAVIVGTAKNPSELWQSLCGCTITFMRL